MRTALRTAIFALVWVAVSNSTALPPNRLALEDQANRDVELADRKELVRPAPKGFKRGKKPRQVTLTLIPREKAIKVGQSFWYRLELQNTGHERLEIQETPSFLKDGASYSAQKWEFYATGPDGERKEMIPGTLADELLGSMRETASAGTPVPSTITALRREELDIQETARRKASSRLRVNLFPGETLLSRPWRWLTQLQYVTRKSRGESIIWPKPDEPFRELWTVYWFKTPGRYAIEAEYVDEPPPPLSEEYLRRMENLGVAKERMQRLRREDQAAALGRIRSNRVEVEVLP